MIKRIIGWGLIVLGTISIGLGAIIHPFKWFFVSLSVLIPLGFYILQRQSKPSFSIGILNRGTGTTIANNRIEGCGTGIRNEGKDASIKGNEIKGRSNK